MNLNHINIGVGTLRNRLLYMYYYLLYVVLIMLEVCSNET